MESSQSDKIKLIIGLLACFGVLVYGAVVKADSLPQELKKLVVDPIRQATDSVQSIVGESTTSVNSISTKDEEATSEAKVYVATSSGSIDVRVESRANSGGKTQINASVNGVPVTPQADWEKEEDKFWDSLQKEINLIIK